jgi:dihydrofolate synthase/folylpolyglutamate synthase
MGEWWRKPMDYQEAIKYIYGHTNYEAVPRPHSEGNYDLRRVYELLEALGNPHLKARSVHIAGTNGKGSTAAMLAAVLTEAGYNTGLYTSPHLITTRERFTVNGRMISEQELAEIITRLEPEIAAVDQRATYGRLTVFEILTVLGFVYFAEKRCDFQVMEVGMGGRYDATNVIQPEVSLLASISYDHCDILGNSLTEIAREKCGIIKPGCTVVSHPQEEAAAAVIRETCQEKGVNLITVGQDITRRSLGYNFEQQRIEVDGRLCRYKAAIPLLGPYQLDNAAAAIAAIEVLVERGWRISRDNIIRGLANVHFPGRMNIISNKPWIVVDGGHNPGAARRLREALSSYFSPTRYILVIGISSDKDVPCIISELAPISNLAITTRANSSRAAKPEALAAELAKHSVTAKTTESVAEAIKEAISIADKGDLICVTGSLYVVGEAMEYIEGYSGHH